MDRFDRLDTAIDATATFASTAGFPMLAEGWTPSDSVRTVPAAKLQVALNRANAEIRAAKARETSCRVLFREQDGWRIQDMKALARHLRERSDLARAKAEGNVFETQPDRKYVWVDVAW